jgi:hypothetical protein
MMRVLYDLSAEGFNILVFDSTSNIDINLCKKLITNFAGPLILYCDDFADYVSRFAELYNQISRHDFVLVASERSYRINFIMQELGGIPYEVRSIAPFNKVEAQELILKMDSLGLTAPNKMEWTLEQQAIDISNDSISVAVCRIMNDFRPIEKIVSSLIDEADGSRLERYIACALASYCYKQGVKYSILSSAFENTDLEQQLHYRDILPLAFSDKNTRDYLIPCNPGLSFKMLQEVSEKQKDLMFDVYCGICAALSSYVTRTSMIQRTPEARMTGRLFDVDEVLAQFLGDRSEEFYVRMKRYWDWNSRYWEQLALLTIDKFWKQTPSKDYRCLRSGRWRFCCRTSARRRPSDV